MTRTLLRPAAGALVLAAILLAIRGGSAADHPIPPPLKKKPPTSFECRWAATEIKIDGAADDAAWKHAEVIDAFHLPWLGKEARMARTATKARLLWDREYFYFFAELEDSDLFAQVKEQDGQTWDDDVFEIFLRPDREKPGYYEFQVNAAGTKFDCFFPKRNAGKLDELKKDGTFHIQSKVVLRGTLNKRTDDDKGWSVEGRIPWTDFLRTGGRPAPGETWAFNLCRYDYHKDWKEPELSCVAPVKQRSFHEIESYATLTFVPVDQHTSAEPIGLPKREPLTTSTVVGFPDPPPPYRAVRRFDKFRPEYPIMVRHIPGSDQLLVITQPRSYGSTTIHRFPDRPDATEKDAVKVLDTPHGGTATDLTFHPDFEHNGYVYIGWSGDPKDAKTKHARITRYTMKPTPPYDLDPASATTIIEWESNGHKGAAVCFGTDGMMYVTTGDGTSDSDTNLTGQRTDLLLAKLLRIDVDHPGEPGGVSPRRYSVPKDNPYVGDKRFVPETWAYGLRNPWRICSDPKTGHIWVGQNGQDLWESAMLIEKGANYGWSVMEGSHPFYLERKAGPTPIIKPTVEHHHSEARSLTGGIVYHGSKLPGLKGAYIYGDYSTGHIWAVKHDGKKILWHEKIAITPMRLTAFAEDSKGELLICDHAGPGVGGFFTLEPNPAPKDTGFPKKLSDSGLFDSVKDHKVKPGVIPYSVNASFWSDGAYKERYVALPEGVGITFKRNRGWDFGDTSVLIKSFALEEREGDPSSRKWVETRFLTKQGGEWYGYSYEWNADGTDATLIGAAGKQKTFEIRTADGGTRRQTWHYPGRAECMVCHSRAQNFVLGLTELQMNKPHDYGNGRVENQIRAFERLGLFAVDWYAEVKNRVKAPHNIAAADQRQPKPAVPGLFTRYPTGLKSLVDPEDKTQDINLRARSWLHANCSSCHVEAGGGNAQMELEFTRDLDKMRILDEKPVHQTFDLPDAKLLVPGHPERSILIHRLSHRGPNTGQMPPLATSRVDEAAVELMREWCRGLRK